MVFDREGEVGNKHSEPFPCPDLQIHIEWTRLYPADALIVPRRMMGNELFLHKVHRARQLATWPIPLGMGIRADPIADFPHVANRSVVGSTLKFDHPMDNLVVVARVGWYEDVLKAVCQA